MLRRFIAGAVLVFVVTVAAAALPAVAQPAGMVLIPTGRFDMGDHHGDGGPDELPVHTVYIGAFYMDTYEVTNQQYADALNWALDQGLIYVSDGVVYGSGGLWPYCYTTVHDARNRITWDGDTFGVATGKEDHPVVRVTWHGAAACANWRSTQDGRTPCYNVSTWECDFAANGYRLATEAEWEYAARGGEHDPYYRYPWGDGIDGSMANYTGSGDPYETGDIPWTTPVGYYSLMANGYGLYDMAGNVWEWCNDWYAADYYGSSPYYNPQGPASGTHRVVRGGGYFDGAILLRCARRVHLAGGGQLDGGFRLALPGDQAIPTVSEWGLVAMTLLVLASGTLIYVRRRPVAP